MAEVFTKEVKIRFGDCDPAGIVYHPQYYYILNFMMEEFLDECIGMRFVEKSRRIGLPVAGIRTEFVETATVGDVLECRIWIENLGEKSVRFAMTLADKKTGALKVKCVQTCIFVTMTNKLESVQIPEDLRSRFEEYLKDEDAPDLTFRT